MLVDSLWDQEDIYGAIAVYKAIKPKDTNNDKVFLVLGPLASGQEIGDGSALGPVKFNATLRSISVERFCCRSSTNISKTAHPRPTLRPFPRLKLEQLVATPAAWPAGCRQLLQA